MTQKDKCIPKFTAASLIIAKIWSHLNAHQWMDKKGSAYTGIAYTGILLRQKVLNLYICNMDDPWGH